LVLNYLGWNTESTSNQRRETQHCVYSQKVIQHLEVILKQKLGVAVAVFLLTVGSKGQQPTNTDSAIAKTIFVPPGGNRLVEPTGNIKIKVSGADTGGAVAVLEVQTDPDFSTPVHVHHVENEWFYAIEGE
jgi:hypothetical protein